jgi:hypothetical protein
MAVANSKNRLVCFGRKKFKLTDMHEYFEKTKHCKTPKDMQKFTKENPYYDIFEIDISSCYDNEKKEFYNHACGMIGNCGGDFFWDSEYSLKVLRARGIPEYHIPKFLKNHKEIEARFLAGEDYSDLLNKKPQNYELEMSHGIICWSFTYILGGDNRNDPDLYDPEEGKNARIAELESIIKGFKCILVNSEILMTPDERVDLELRLIQKEQELDFEMADDEKRAILEAQIIQKEKENEIEIEIENDND